MAKFNHQPFEDWLLSGQVLGPEASLELQGHLEGCEECQRLSAALGDVQQLLRAAPEHTPAPGFTSRWQARLAQERQSQDRRQRLYILSFSVGGAALTLFILGMLLLPLLSSPLPLALTFAYKLVSLASLTNDTATILGRLFQTLVAVVPPALWIGMAVAAASMCVIWFVAVTRLAFQRRVG
jgi:anti-sigma factor RsiW